MSGRDLIDEIRSGGAVTSKPRRATSVFDVVTSIAAIVAVGALAFFAYGAWFGPPSTPLPVATAPTASAIMAVDWTEDDEKACTSRGRAAARNPDTGNYMITNAPIADGVAFLATKVECQLTTKITRFCGPGKSQVVAIVNDYLGRMDIIVLGLAAQGAPMAIAGGLLGGEAAAGDSIYSSMKADTIAYMKSYDRRVVSSLRALASKGVVVVEDFKPFPFGGVPKRIQEIFAGQLATAKVCG